MSLKESLGWRGGGCAFSKLLGSAFGAPHIVSRLSLSKGWRQVFVSKNQHYKSLKPSFRSVNGIQIVIVMMKGMS